MIEELVITIQFLQKYEKATMIDVPEDTLTRTSCESESHEFHEEHASHEY
jgi:hypothetical protein